MDVSAVEFICVRTHGNISSSLRHTQRPLFVLTKLNYLVSYPVMNFTDLSECVNVKCLTSWPSDLNWSDSTKLSIRGERRINPRNVGEVAACAYITAKTRPVCSSCRWRKQALRNASFPTSLNHMSISDETIIHPDPVLSLRGVGLQPTSKIFSGKTKTCENGQSVKM